ncbi:MAG: 3'-5' exonuclease [Burkholderiaceae bacterium]|jgi:DNA polymerase-3 subunit epsilon|nr:3'-5' exonuclease [Burkholderiaceae bacterium]
MKHPLSAALNAWRVRRSLDPDGRARLDRLRIRLDHMAARPYFIERTPLALARFVALDLETTGPNMLQDQIISIGAVTVEARTVRHDGAFDVVLRQRRPSEVQNILVHQIGGQQQMAGDSPVATLLDFLEFLDETVVVAFRAEFDETVLTREVNQVLGLPQQHTFLDLAVLLPSVFPDTQNDTLDDWARHFGIRPIGRHRAVADAYTNAQLMLPVLDQAQRNGVSSVGELIRMERAQRWLGKRR